MGLSNVDSEKHAKLYICPGREFVWLLSYLEEEEFGVSMHPNYLSVDYVNETSTKLVYGEHRIHKIYIKKPNVQFEQSLHPFKTDKDVHLLINLYLNDLVFLHICGTYEF